MYSDVSQYHNLGYDGPNYQYQIYPDQAQPCFGGHEVFQADQGCDTHSAQNHLDQRLQELTAEHNAIKAQGLELARQLREAEHAPQG